MRVLRSRLYEVEEERLPPDPGEGPEIAVSAREIARKKIRTYNFPQNRLTEPPHRPDEPQPGDGDGRPVATDGRCADRA